MKIGSIEISSRVLAAPMAGVTDAASRLIARRLGAGMTFTEMASALGVVRCDAKTLSLISAHPESRPYSVQLFGSDPASLGEAAKAVEELGAEAVDLNVACPVRKILKSGTGGALLKNLPLVGRILSSMRAATSLPLTVKIRGGFDPKSHVAPELARIAESEGLDAVTVHGRYVSDGFRGAANWDIIRETVAAVKIPVIGNGDVKSAQDAVKMMSETGCAAVMVGRASLGNPFIFREIDAALEGKPSPPKPTPKEKLDLALEQFNLMAASMQQRVAVWLWRKHLCWYAKGLRRAAELRREIMSTEDPKALIEIATQYFENAQHEFDECHGQTRLPVL